MSVAIDWAVREPLTDFGVNAVGTTNMLEHTTSTARMPPPSCTSSWRT